MLYRFVSRDGNVVRIGAEDADALELKLQFYLDHGFAFARAEEHDEQIIRGAVSGVSEPKENPTPSVNAPEAEKGEET